ncbi:MAG: hemerythrin domain-containing protein [Deltaproteobacteria bacterium]|nr:hemerythrin domain-containing protein [Deltaproteobacteria bacterium]MBW2421494.1 hemerythrin domain-containing protein [Deltaproteobacteria bacterium]
MTATEVATKVESEHARLRGMAGVLQSLALRVVRGDDDLTSALRLKGEELLERFDRHVRWEEDYLLPLLRRAGAEGEACSERLREDHRRQRDRLSASLADLHHDAGKPRELARGLLDVIEWLERDMATEDARLLGSGLLREAPPS